jgi:tetratricopeptide (TPR) repeat protein
LRRTSQSDLDQRAWLLTQKARVTLASGDAKSADDILSQVSRLFPDSQQASLVMADLEVARGNYKEAASILENCYQAAPSAAILFRWANALRQAGQNEKAAVQFAAFEEKARAEISKPYNDNLDLIAYYCDHKPRPAEALRIATLESASRQDVATLAAFAWALYQNGKFIEAKTQMDKALAVGIREPDYLCHSSLISAKVSPAAQSGPATCSGQTSWSSQRPPAPLGASK